MTLHELMKYQAEGYWRMWRGSRASMHNKNFLFNPFFSFSDINIKMAAQRFQPKKRTASRVVS